MAKRNAYSRKELAAMSERSHARAAGDPEKLEQYGREDAAKWIAAGQHWDGVTRDTEAAEFADGIASRGRWGSDVPTAGLPNQAHGNTLKDRRVIERSAEPGHSRLTRYGIGCLRAREDAGFRIGPDSPPSDPWADMEARAAQRDDGLTETERDAVVQSRVGQGRFRRDVLNAWDGCAVTGIADAALLRASHVKPWKDSTDAERLDPANGLALIAPLDHLFDAGFVTFEDDGELIRHPGLQADAAAAFGLIDSMRLRAVPEGLLPYLSHHREHVFGRLRATR
ncbi:HNH endonuclease [Alienimonas sp. DA493]|uniref:HNH endonuclease n=1 Tax=Alienimonas sp. DA493 TaxID=3373605 RepID=UPI003754D3B3